MDIIVIVKNLLEHVTEGSEMVIRNICPNTGEVIIKCPKHPTIDMLKLTNGKFVIDKCPKCGGIFLDKEEIGNAKKMSFISYIREYFRK